MCSYTFTYLAVHVCAFIDRNFMFPHSILRSEIRQKLKEDVEAIRADNEGFKPGLAIVQVTYRSAQGGGELPYKSDGDACRKLELNP